jgi:hypothetical protein
MTNDDGDTGRKQHSSKTSRRQTMDVKPRVAAKPIDMDAGTADTSSAKPSNSTKVIIHKETKHGDLYALPDKGWNLTDDSKQQIEHLVTDQGDLYALPNRGGRVTGDPSNQIEHFVPEQSDEYATPMNKS